MSAPRLSVSELKEVRRLTYGASLSQRQVARSLSLSKTTVNKYVEGAGAAGPLS